VENKRIINLTCLTFLLSACVFISLSLHLFNGDDDRFFGTALENRTLFEFLDWRYHSWTGRMLIEGLMVLTINHNWYWMLAIPLSCLVVSFSIAVLSGHKNNLILSSSIIFASLMLINHKVNMEAIWWITGSYNYIQPIAAGLLSIAIHLNCKEKFRLLKALSFPLMFFSCFNEQFSVIVLIPYLFFYTIIKRDVKLYNLSFSSLAVITTIFSLTAPGNKSRSMSETASWMPDYHNLNIIDKIALGFDRLSSHLTEQNLIFTIFLIILCFMALRKGNLNTLSVSAMLILSVKISTYFIFTRYSVYLNLFTHSDFLTFGEIATPHSYLKYSLSLLILFSCIHLISIHCVKYSDVIFILLPFILGIASVVVIGMSPTVYASGYRVLFIFNLSIIFVTSTLISKKFYNKI